ncbi:ATP-dependent DNA helicase pif1-like [Phymastichus coffea]|uniref:ATP-dependent DNA helicase pif1-like n=1 Tax=Phymastichus coffea TaxID=108790 RepID=UPI00273B3BD6|nr:ATP-dependent DNA helicase pif1-like [Phymastichus coffea]
MTALKSDLEEKNLYIYKGHDCAYIELKHAGIKFKKGNNTNDNENVEDEIYNHDEVKQYLNTRYLCPPEAMWRLFKYDIYKMSHAIIRLAIHEDGQQDVYFKEGEEELVKKLRTVDGILHNTYFEAAKARQLIGEDEEWDKCLEEATKVQFPDALRQLFAIICVFHNPTNARELYEKYKTHFYHPKYTNEMDYDNRIDDDLTEMLLENNESSNDTLENKINGPGGSGKSYLLNILIDYLQTQKHELLCVAWTGIAANLLKNGKTVHTTFKMPLSITETTVCNIKPNSKEGEIMRNAKVIIWDEISMTSKMAFEAVDRSLRDICNNDLPFGGKIIIASGDFRQILPVVRHGSRTEIIENLVKNCEVWRTFKRMALTENVRVSDDDRQFKNWLLQVGEGKRSNEFEEEHELQEIPKTMITKRNDIVEEIFGSKLKNNDTTISKKVILAPTNNDVMHINNEILNKMEGKSIQYLSVDTAEDDNGENLDVMLPTEFLNEKTPNGLPPYKLYLKIGAVIILMRNLNITEGLCNGTRLIVKALQKYSISAEILSGTHIGKTAIIPRISLSPSKEDIPFNMKRRQFPIRLGFAMTINKSQGQSYDNVGGKKQENLEGIIIK